MPERGPLIAILGWGSLLWEPHSDFDAWHEKWLPDGPKITLEFSRISSTRLGALTLVIDSNGTPTKVSYCLSKRKEMKDAVADLQRREGTSLANIGIWSEAAEYKGKNSDARETIRVWGVAKGFTSVIWTDLVSNFQDVCGKPFSTGTAMVHIQGLDPAAKVKAAEYMWRAPEFVQTKLRRAFQLQPWFPQTGD